MLSKISSIQQQQKMCDKCKEKRKCDPYSGKINKSIEMVYECPKMLDIAPKKCTAAITNTSKEIKETMFKE